MNLLVRGQTGTCVYAGSREHSCSPQTFLTFPRESGLVTATRPLLLSGRYELTTGAQAIWTGSKVLVGRHAELHPRPTLLQLARALRGDVGIDCPAGALLRRDPEVGADVARVADMDVGHIPVHVHGPEDGRVP